MENDRIVVATGAAGEAHPASTDEDGSQEILLVTHTLNAAAAYTATTAASAAPAA